MKRLDIRLAAQYSGIKAHTIRIWEQRYGLLTPQKGAGNRREYSKEDIVVLMDIALLTKFGYTISKLAQLPKEKIKEIITKISSSAAGADICVNKLLQSYLYSDLFNLERTLDDFISRKGAHLSIKEVIVPFIQRAELFSYTDYHSASNFTANALKHKIITASETLPNDEAEEETILLFLPPGYHFDLILILMKYQLRIAGFQLIYMGANTALDVVVQIAGMFRANVLLTYVAPTDKTNIKDLHREVRSRTDHRLIILGAVNNKQKLADYTDIFQELRNVRLVNG